MMSMGKVHELPYLGTIHAVTAATGQLLGACLFRDGVNGNTTSCGISNPTLSECGMLEGHHGPGSLAV